MTEKLFIFSTSPMFTRSAPVTISTALVEPHLQHVRRRRPAPAP
jgi:hypothetical protein